MTTIETNKTRTIQQRKKNSPKFHVSNLENEQKSKGALEKWQVALFLAIPASPLEQNESQPASENTPNLHSD